MNSYQVVERGAQWAVKLADLPEDIILVGTQPEALVIAEKLANREGGLVQVIDAGGKILEEKLHSTPDPVAEA